MTPAEVAMVLGLAALRDRRTVGELEVRAWHQDIGDLDFEDAKLAVSRHYRETTEWLMPAHVRRHVEAIDRERRRAERERLEYEQSEREVERAITSGTLKDRSAEVRAFVAQIRSILPHGDPDKLRYGHREWREARERHERARRAEPNPHYDPAAAARLAEMNADLAGAPDDAPAPESESTS